MKIEKKPIKIRRFWNRNPITKIKQSKRKDRDRLFTNKEIKEMLKEGDF